MSITARIPLALGIISILFVSHTCLAAQIPGPHGGRILKSGKISVEFTVDKDEHPHIFRLNEKGEAIGLGTMSISLKALIPKKTISISLSRTTEGLGTDNNEKDHMAGASPMPGLEEYPVEVSVKLGKTAVKLRFQFIDGICAECGLPAFSCTCPESKED